MVSEENLGCNTLSLGPDQPRLTMLLSSKMLLALMTVTGLSTHAHAPLKAYKHPITIWVPPYSVANSKAALQTAGVKDGITHLDFQFWVPTKTGQAVLTKSDEVNDQLVIELRDWAHSGGIRAMLCVFNGADTWDWPLARAAFADHRDEFVKSLVDQMEHYRLDGIDIDLEGPGQYEADKPTFLAFMTELSKQVHKRHKHLTVDSFSYVWNAPNQGWWPDLFPLVEEITTMGYEGIGLGASDWKSYSEQRKAAGAFAAKLQLGVPSDRDKWQGNTAIEQLGWIENDNQTGVAIWDAQLPAKSWKTPELWKTLKAIRDGK